MPARAAGRTGSQGPAAGRREMESHEKMSFHFPQQLPAEHCAEKTGSFPERIEA
jgi:hypothetical protein